MMKHANFKVITAIVVVLILAAITTMPLLAAANYSYQFEPNSNYAQSDDKVILRIFPGTSADPTQVTWIDPQGAHVSCSGGQGVCWDQSVSANGDLIWRVFYLPIAGYQRPSGTYTAIVYNFSSELFRADFYISGATITPTPTPTPIPIGTLDPTFGSGGIVTTDVGDYCTTVAIQSDGKIVVAGTGIYVGDFALARFNTDGSLDTGFGADGKVTTDFGSHDTPRSVAVQEDGKIILAGSSAGDFAIARYNHNGSLDPGFGAAGKVTTDFGASETGNSVAVQDDNKIVAAGYSSLGSELGSNFVLARYNSDGSLDTGFGSGGKVTTSFGGRAYGSSVAVQDDGKIVVAGGSDKN